MRGKFGCAGTLTWIRAPFGSILEWNRAIRWWRQIAIGRDITCTAVEPFTWTDGTVSRRLTLQLLPDNDNFAEYWIEGIGSENGPMGPAAYLCIADWDPHAACLHPSRWTPP